MRVSIPLPLDIEARLRYWHGLGRSDRAIALKLAHEFPGTSWSRMRLRYWRERFGLDGNSHVALESRTLTRQQDLQRCVYAGRRGWAHLLPYRDEDTGVMISGTDLKPREVDILTALDEHGPQTMPQLCLRAGLIYRKACLRSGSDYYVTRLMSAGLIERRPPRAGKPVYGLVPGVTRHVRSLNLTSPEQLLKRLNLAPESRRQDGCE